MDEEQDIDGASGSNIGVGVLVWFFAFAAAWVVFESLTRSTGMTLVLSTFAALIAFDIGRRTLVGAVALVLVSLLVVIIQAFVHFLA